MTFYDPAKVHAIIVGIDHCGFGPRFDLKGPSDDALRYVAWILERGGPLPNIRLFLSQRTFEGAGNHCNDNLHPSD